MRNRYAVNTGTATSAGKLLVAQLSKQKVGLRQNHRNVCGYRTNLGEGRGHAAVVVMVFPVVLGMLLCCDHRLNLGTGMPIYFGRLPTFPRLGNASICFHHFSHLSQRHWRISQGKRGPLFACGHPPHCNSKACCKKGLVARAAQKQLSWHFVSKRVMSSNLHAPLIQFTTFKDGWMGDFFYVSFFVCFFNSLDTSFFISLVIFIVEQIAACTKKASLLPCSFPPVPLTLFLFPLSLGYKAVFVLVAEQ